MNPENDMIMVEQISGRNTNINNTMELLFVYNAESNLTAKFKDYFHKILKPKTYPCKLCAVSYGNFGIKKDWKNYINSLEIPVRFLHKDEFNREFDSPNDKFPCAFLHDSSDLKLIITQDEMNKVNSVEELETLVNKKLNPNP